MKSIHPSLHGMPSGRMTLDPRPDAPKPTPAHDLVSTRVERSPDYMETCAERGFQIARSIAPGILHVHVDLLSKASQSPLQVISAAELPATLKNRLTEALQDGRDPRIPVTFSLQLR